MSNGIIQSKGSDMDYHEFLESKRLVTKAVGKAVEPGDLSDALFPFQRDLTRWAVRKGRAAIFADTGLGKTPMQVEWARLIGDRTLIYAPLSVARQTVNIARNLLGVEVHYTRSDDDLIDGINITNYEMLDHFDMGKFGAVVLDESSILKSMDGSIRQALTEKCKDVPYRLCCTATPAPNDIKEIANHAEFLGIMSRSEMLSVFFRYSQSGGQDKVDAWRLKSHAVNDFYRWLASWGMAIRQPSDLGYSDEGYVLPPLTTHLHTFPSSYTPPGVLPGFLIGGISALDAKKLRREVLTERLDIVQELVNEDSDQWVLWCGLNEEGDKLEKLIPDSVQVYGSQTPETKAELIEAWQDGKYRVLITKAKIAGFGMNFQNAHKTAFVGIDYSWESYYQCVRRLWRFGQEYPVENHIILAEQEYDVYNLVMAKEREAVKMSDELVKHSAQYASEEIKGELSMEFSYRTDEKSGDGWRMMLGDSTERMAELPDNSVDLSIYSPPFSDLFVYSNTPRDVGNSRNWDEFFEHYGMIIRENLRITKPGRLCAVHCQDLRSYQNVDGLIGRKDFTGQVIEAYMKEGWTYWHRITIDKDPQVQAVRLKDHRLLFITLKKDSTDLAGGYADYLLLFKKPGENEVPVIPDVSTQEWIEFAHPVWYDIRETDVLPVRQAKANDDEKHMCPLQLPVIERTVRLWSNKGEMVFSPFAGIGSEGHEAVRLDRNFIGIELKPEYYNVALVNLANAERQRVPDLFQWAAMQEVAQNEVE